jgi:hypothetical protein
MPGRGKHQDPWSGLLNISRIIFTGFMVFMWAGQVLGAAPLVQNVTIAQRTDGSMLVDITYDVSDADGDTLAITLHLSQDGGATWDYPVLNLSGDVGQGVLPGAGRVIVWDAGTIPEAILGEKV